MSNHVFVISEWLPKEDSNQECWKQMKKVV